MAMEHTHTFSTIQISQTIKINPHPLPQPRELQ